MNLKIISESNKNRKPVLIGKTGLLRLSNHYAKLFGITKSEKWQCGLDMDEKSPKSIYVIKANINNIDTAKKMSYVANSWALNMNMVVEELKLKLPKKFEIEAIIDDELEGFKLKLIQ